MLALLILKLRKEKQRALYNCRLIELYLFSFSALQESFVSLGDDSQLRKPCNLDLLGLFCVFVSDTFYKPSSRSPLKVVDYVSVNLKLYDSFHLGNPRVFQILKMVCLNSCSLGPKLCLSALPKCQIESSIFV